MLLTDSRRSHKTLFLWLGFITVFVFVVTGIAYLILYSDLFTVSAFNVEGAHLSPNPETVISALAMQSIQTSRTLGILGKDHTLFWLFGERDKVRDRHTLHAIAAFNVDVDVLRRNVQITVKERSLRGIVCAKEKNCYAFDDEGMIFAPAPFGKGVLITQIIDPNERPLVLGEAFLPRPQWVTNMFAVLNSIENSGLLIAGITLRDIAVQEWEATLTLGPKLFFDFNVIPDDLDTVLTSLGERVDFSRLQYLDFRVQNRVYYK